MNSKILHTAILLVMCTNLLASDCYDYILRIGGGEADNQIVWNLVKNGVVIHDGHGFYEDTLCLEDACYELNMWDTYGDGWNGAIYTLMNSDGIFVANGDLESASDGDGISWGSDVICTEPLPLPPCLFEVYVLSVLGGSPSTDITWSFSPEGGAPVANGGVPSTVGLCLDDGCFTIIMLDAGGDGWNGGVYTLSELDTGDIVATGTMDSGSGPELGYFDVGTGACIILPVELVDFDGRVEKEYNEIWWKTASESNSSHFCIERTQNGTDWKEIAVLDGQGTSNESSSYSFEDFDYEVGTNYYRLKQVDLNGHFEYSRTIALKNEIDFNLNSVYPNPSKHGYSLNISSAFEMNIDISLVDVSGRIAFSQRVHISDRNQTLMLDEMNLSQGMYSLVIYSENRNILAQQGLIKQ